MMNERLSAGHKTVLAFRAGSFWLSALTVCLAVSACSSSGPPSADKVPPQPAPAAPSRTGAETLVDEAVVSYLANRLSFVPNVQNYEALDDYLNFGTTLTFRDGGHVRLDENGLPTVLYSDGLFHYNPVTLSQFALHLHGRLLAGEDVLATFRRAVDMLVSLQDAEGAFRYDFAFRIRTGEVLAPGWVSGMAQGQALSTLARALEVTGDPNYRNAGEAALSFLQVPIAEGGVVTTLGVLDPALGDYLFVEEYPANPPGYTLNGYMFALLGLYDWWHLPGGGASAEKAGELFWSGIDALEQLLPYCDLGGFSTYDVLDLTHPPLAPNLSPSYHRIHIYLLHALHSVTGREVLDYYRALWAAYVLPDRRFPPYLEADQGTQLVRGPRLRFASDEPPLENTDYRFSLRHPSGEWQVARPYGAVTTWEWDTVDEPPGSYYVKVETRPAGATDRNGSRIVRVDLWPISPLGVALKSAQQTGDNGDPVIVFRAEAEGGDPPFEYRYWLKAPGGSWVLVRNFGYDPEWTWFIGEAVPEPHHVQVDARSTGAVAGKVVSAVVQVSPQ
jgi:hypothetical protein